MRRTRFLPVVGLPLASVLASVLALAVTAGCAGDQGGSAADPAAGSPSATPTSAADATGPAPAGTAAQPPSGTSGPPPVELVTATIRVDASLPDNEIRFGTLRPGGRAVATVDVVNNLGAVMTIADISVSLESQAFKLTSDKCTGVDVQPGQTCQLRISFIPTRIGDHSGSLDVTASYELGLYVPLRGIGS